MHMGASESKSTPPGSNNGQKPKAPFPGNASDDSGGTPVDAFIGDSVADSFWVEKTEARVNMTNTVAPGMTTKPNVPDNEITPGCEPTVVPVIGASGLNMYRAMNREWRVRTVRNRTLPLVCEMEPDDIIDAIEDTPGDPLDPPVHLPTMLELLTDVWDENGLYD
eukprot:Tbor_TRINITY_DN5318_c0_g1::TRINITY_DN5318_c0_g1_i2::g.4699::m.4699